MPGFSTEGIEQQAKAFNIHSVDNVQQLLNRMWYHYPWYFRPFTSSIYHSLWKKLISEFVASIREEDFLNITFPTLVMSIDVIWGEDDKLILKESVDVIKQLVPHVKEHCILQCSYVPQLERPHELAYLLKRILGLHEHNKASD